LHVGTKEPTKSSFGEHRYLLFDNKARMRMTNFFFSELATCFTIQSAVTGYTAISTRSISQVAKVHAIVHEAQSFRQHRTIVFPLFFQVFPAVTISPNIEFFGARLTSSDNNNDNDSEIFESDDNAEEFNLVSDLLNKLNSKMKVRISTDEQRMLCIQIHAKILAYSQEKERNQIISSQSKKEMKFLLGWTNYLFMISDEIYNYFLRISLESISDFALDAVEIINNVSEKVKDVLSLKEMSVICNHYENELKTFIEIPPRDIALSKQYEHEMKELISWGSKYETLFQFPYLDSLKVRIQEIRDEMKQSESIYRLAPLDYGIVNTLKVRIQEIRDEMKRSESIYRLAPLDYGIVVTELVYTMTST
jgi:hypothetical protein